MIEMVASSIVLALAWFAGLNAIASALAAFAGLAIGRRDTTGRPRLLLTIRLFPSVASLLFVGVMFLPSQWALEPRDANETFGVVLFCLASAGALLLVRSLARAIGVAAISRRAGSGTRRATERAGVLEVEDLPGVSLTGILKPQILIGPQVVSELSVSELDVAIAHEVAHREALDNVARWFMLCAPDLLSGSAIARQLELSWHAAAESRADARAAKGDTTRAVHLASALIKVARLSAGWTGTIPAPSWSTLNDCSLLEVRVRRLVGGPAPAADPAASRFRLLAVGLGVLFIAIPLFAAPLHRLTEALVAILP